MLAAPTFTSGYYKDPGKTAEIYHSRDGQPFVTPGDYGRINADGTITLMGRGSGVVNTGGEKVFAEEVEGVVKSYEGVEDCLVFGTPDDRFGHVVTAVVQPRTGFSLDLDALVEHVGRHLARYKVPRRILIDKVPRHPNGKQDYAAAKALTEQIQSASGLPGRS
jgi:fatty-acyl-CoA synthase